MLASSVLISWEPRWGKKFVEWHLGPSTHDIRKRFEYLDSPSALSSLVTDLQITDFAQISPPQFRHHWMGNEIKRAPLERPSSKQPDEIGHFCGPVRGEHIYALCSGSACHTWQYIVKRRKGAYNDKLIMDV